LFKFLATPALAGAMAARLFSAQSWLSVGCALLLLLSLLPRADREDAEVGELPAPAGPSAAALLPVLGGLLLALLIEYAVAPRIVARQNLQLWHKLGTLMFVLQWLCAAAVLWRLGRTGAGGPARSS